MSSNGPQRATESEGHVKQSKYPPELELDLKPLTAYLSTNGAPIEIDHESQSEIARQRSELLREFKEFRSTKQELLNLKEESNLDAASRNAEQQKFEEKVIRKKKELEQQWRNLVDDYKDIAQYKRTRFGQIVEFEDDPDFQKLKNSALSDDEKHQIEAALKQYRAEMVRKYMEFYALNCSQFQHIL